MTDHDVRLAADHEPTGDTTTARAPTVVERRAVAPDGHVPKPAELLRLPTRVATAGRMVRAARCDGDGRAAPTTTSGALAFRGARIQRSSLPSVLGGATGGGFQTAHLTRTTIPTIQRRVDRGSGTGWGALRWVDGGKELWDRIDHGFNVELPRLQSELDALLADHEGVRPAKQSIDSFISLWDGKSIHHQVNPQAGQKISAETFAKQIADKITRATDAIDVATTPVPEPEPEPEPEPDPVLDETPTSTTEPVLTKAPKVQQKQQKAKPPSKKELAAIKAAEKKEKQARKEQTRRKEAEGRAEEHERKRQANDKARIERQAREREVTAFETKVAALTERFVHQEKAYGWSGRPTDLSQVFDGARASVRTLTADEACRRAYAKWLKRVAEVSTANELEKRGTTDSWRAWSGLSSYQVIEEQGTYDDSGGTTFDIHITFDEKSAQAPSRSLNGLSLDEAVLEILGVIWHEQIHATVETPTFHLPKAYWGGSDGRAHEYTGVDGWDDADGPRATAQAVVRRYVDDVVKPKIELQLRRLQFDPYVWPDYETASQ